MARLESQMEDIMGYPTGGDPSIIDPTTGKPYDDSSRMRQQAEITRQADVKEEFQPVELPKLLEERIEKAVTKEVSTDDLGTAYDDYRGSYNKIDDEGFLLNPKEPLNLSDGETLRPVLRTDNFKSPIDKVAELNYLLTDPSIRDETKRIVSGLDENTEFGENAIQGFYDSVAKNQGLSATENAWCAAFVHYILTELGADTLKGLGGQRARKYIDYGSPVKIEDAQEGDIVIFDFNGDGRGQHVAFYAGTRITDQDNPNTISVVGGNQNNKVTLTTRDMGEVLGIRRITKDNINVSLSKDLAKNNPIFKQFVPKSTPVEDMKLMQTPPLANIQQTSPFSIIPSSYNEGGMTMKDQTQMAFALGGEAETVDPVSGNDVPPGSLPEEVRDDIDARLSEGEYVVPADVVRFFGVKFFEDLRTEAKMGLQQMDADGRIGGEPVPAPEQEDSMDVAELKAELSKSGMYAGGLTDGGGLDTFIDDASRDPMVNGRMRASGATVKMAVGGLAVGNYGDVTKVDGIIKKLMTAANKDPALMEKLASKGIMINKTGADKKPNEMQQANRPNEPIMAAEGTLVQPRAFSFGGTTEADTSQLDNPFNINSFNTLGKNLFEAAGIQNPEKVVTDTFLNKEGKIEQIVLIAPDGSEIPVAWNNTMPLPPGFTRKATDDYGVKPAASTKTNSVFVDPVDEKPRRTGDDSNVGAMPTPTASSGTGFNAGNPEDYSKSTIKELQEHLKTTKNYAKAGFVASLALGPLGSLIGLATKANQAIVERRIENELKRRADKAKTKNLRQINNLDNKALSEEELITLDALQTSLRIANNLSDTGEIIATGKDGEPVGFNPVRSILNAIFEPAADRIDARVKAKRDAAGGIQDGVDNSSSSYSSTGVAPTLRPKLRPTTLSQLNPTQKVAQQAAAKERLTAKQQREEAGRIAAAQRAADAARLDSDRTSGNRTSYTTSGGSTYVMNPDGTRGYTGGTNWSTGKAAADRQAAEVADREKGYEQQRSDFFSGLFNDGGLVAKPAAKQKKKRTTQRRKGLGTRP